MKEGAIYQSPTRLQTLLAHTHMCSSCGQAQPSGLRGSSPRMSISCARCGAPANLRELSNDDRINIALYRWQQEEFPAASAH